MSALDHLKEYRVVQISLPRNGGELETVDGVALATAPPIFEVTFLPDHLQPETLNEQGSCRLTYLAPNGSLQTINAEIVTVVSDSKLHLRLLEGYSQEQKRAYFRVDTNLAVSYWSLDDTDANACSAPPPVNLSGGGIRIAVKKALRKGSDVGLEIILDDPRPRVIECVATVIRSFRLGGVMQMAMRYTQIEEEDRDAIIAYCFAEQRRQLREKVHMLGTGAP